MPCPLLSPASFSSEEPSTDSVIRTVAIRRKQGTGPGMLVEMPEWRCRRLRGKLYRLGSVRRDVQEVV